jgi:hypothetical protein
MPDPTDQYRLMRTLQEALDLADRLGLGVVGCHIDHALATVERQCALTRQAAPVTTQSLR